MLGNFKMYLQKCMSQKNYNGNFKIFKLGCNKNTYQKFQKGILRGKCIVLRDQKTERRTKPKIAKTRGSSNKQKLKEGNAQMNKFRKEL